MRLILFTFLAVVLMPVCAHSLENPVVVGGATPLAGVYICSAFCINSGNEITTYKPVSGLGRTMDKAMTNMRKLCPSPLRLLSAMGVPGVSVDPNPAFAPKLENICQGVDLAE